MGAADDFRALLEPGAIRAVFQPIVRLTDRETIGYEGLARFPTPPGRALWVNLSPEALAHPGCWSWRARSRRAW